MATKRHESKYCREEMMADTTIREFTVATIKKRIKVKARSPWQAAVEAVKTRRFKSIGMLIEVRDPKSTMFYVSGIKAAKAAGLLVQGIK